MNFLILHGIGGHAGIHWEQWLHDELKEQGHTVIMPELPDSARPSRAQWLLEALQAIKDIDTTDLVIVGHSLGVTTALDLIEQSTTPVKALVSVSGFAIDYGAELNSYFLREKLVDFDRVRANIGTSVVIYGDNDPYVTQEALKHLADALCVGPTIIHEGGHLNTEGGYTKFPRLLDTITQIK
jgi:predicted alpha/beta hydrolase family esterase